MNEFSLSLRDILAYPRTLNVIGNATREWLITPQRCPPLFREFGIALAGWSLAQEDFFFIRPDPAFGQVLACFGGRGEVLVDNEWAICEEGNAYLTAPHILHAYRALPGETWSIAWLHDHNQWLTGQPGLVSVRSDDLFILLQGLYRESMGAAEVTVMQDWLRLIQAHALRIIGAGRTPGRLRALWEAIAADPAHDWNIAEMTRFVGVGEEHLRRLAIHEIGKSPMRQVAAIRMRYAESLLASGRYSISEVSARVGYDNPFAFSTAFKRLMGRPPSTFVPGNAPSENASFEPDQKV